MARTFRPRFQQAWASGLTLDSKKKKYCDHTDTQTMVQGLTSLGKEIRDQHQSFTDESTVSKVEDGEEVDEDILFVSVTTQADVLKSVIEKIEVLEKDNSDMEHKLREISEKCKKLRQTGANRLKRMMGQFAFGLERAIVDRVLNGLIDSDEYVATITDMEKAIKRKPYYGDIFKTEKDRASAEKAWSDLKRELRWTGRHFRYIEELKEHYLPISNGTDLDLTQILQGEIAKGNSQIKDKELFMELIEIKKEILKDHE